MEGADSAPFFVRSELKFLGRKLMVRKIVAIIVLSSSLALAACNTVKGAGEDIQSVGEAGDKAT